MLLRNESRIRHSIDIKLVFDDGKKRELQIQEGDQVQVSYRKNGCIKCGVGVIRKITIVVFSKKRYCCFNRRESAIITLDMSEDHVSCVDKFDIYDIIDIRKLCNCQICPGEINDPDFDITEDEDTSSDADDPLTDEGVDISD